MGVLRDLVAAVPESFGQIAKVGLTEISRYDAAGPAWYSNNITTGEHTGQAPRRADPLDHRARRARPRQVRPDPAAEPRALALVERTERR